MLCVYTCVMCVSVSLCVFRWAVCVYRCGLTEMSVLLDVLNLVKEKQYLVADPASQDTPDTRPAVQLLAKKKVSPSVVPHPPDSLG